MSLAENLLNSLAETTSQSTSPINDILVIDAESRTIQVPATETLFGVVTDGNSERKYFRCPRIVGDNIDLTTLNLRVNYRNALGEDDGYIVTDVKVSGDFITFSWKLEGKLFKAKGPIYFAICAVEVDGNGVETCAWNTTLATGEVLDGFRVILTETEEEQARDILQQLLNLLQTRSDEAVQDVTAEGTKQVANVESVGVTQRALIESKGAETLATIPEDYTTTYNNADESLRKKAKAILLEGTGEVISVNDASGDHVRGLKVFGKSEQVTTNGYQLFDVGALKSYSTDGVSIVPNEDGSITISGSGTLTKDFGVDKKYTHEETVSLLKSGEIHLLVDKSTSPYIYMHLANSSGKLIEITNFSKNSESTTITDEMLADETTILKIGYYGIAGKTIVPGIIKPMVYQDGDGTWEAFSGGKPAPNPEYPHDIMSLGDDDIVVGLYGSNIINPKTLLVSTNTSLEVSDDGYTIKAVGGTTSGWCSSVFSLPTTMVYLLRGKTVRIGCDTFTTDRSDANVRAGFNVKLDDGTSIYPASISPNHTTNTETIPENAVSMTFGIYTNNSGDILDTDNTIVVEGLRVSVSEYTDWEEYKEMQTIAIPRSLPGIPVSSGGNYTDSDGQQWICDEVDFERGVYVRRVLKEIISGTPNFEETEDCPGRYLWQSALSKCYSAGRVFAFSNFASWTTWAEGTAGKDWFAIDRYKLYYKPAETTTASEVNTLFTEMITSDTAPVILAVLDTPIETPLTADELDAFRTLHTNYPTTTVLNDSGATMQFIYNADTKGYIEKNYVSRLEYNDLVTRITALENK